MKKGLIICTALLVLLYAAGAAFADWQMFRRDALRTGEDPDPLGSARPKPIWVFPAYVPPIDPMDNDYGAVDVPGFVASAAWNDSNPAQQAPDGYESNYLWVQADHESTPRWEAYVGPSATWTFDIATDGNYLVNVWFPSDAPEDENNRVHVRDAHYMVRIDRGSTGTFTTLGRFTMDQSSGGNWQNLGGTTFSVQAGDKLQIMLTAETQDSTAGSDTIVVADAVQIDADTGTVLSSPVSAKRNIADTVDDLVITSVTETRPLEQITASQYGDRQVGVIYGLMTEDDIMSTPAVDDRGRKVWQFPDNPDNWIEGGISSTPLVTTVGGEELAIVPAHDGQVYAVRTADGTLFWQGPGVVVHNPTSETGAWVNGTHAGYQSDTTLAVPDTYLRVPAVVTGNATATWKRALPAAGRYAVYVWIPPSTSTETYISDATYTVVNGSQSTNVRVDQRNGGRWVRLGGSYNVAAGDLNNVEVTLTNQTLIRDGGGGVPGNLYVAADAVKFVPADLGSFEFSSPVSSGDGTVAGTRVYVGSTGGRVYALRLNQEDPVWTYPAVSDNPMGAIYASPALDSEVAPSTLYIGSSDGHVYAVNIANGAERWVYPLKTAEGDVQYKLGEISSTTAVGSSLYVAIGGGYSLGYDFDTSGRIVALDTSAGAAVGRAREDWWYPTIGTNAKGAFLYSSPLIMNVLGQPFLGIGSTDGRFYGLNSSTGAGWVESGIWQLPDPSVPLDDRVYPDLSGAVYSSPAGVITGYSKLGMGLPAVPWEVAFVGSESGSIYGIDLLTGKKDWFRNLLGPSISSPATYRQRIYTADRGGYTWAFSTRGDGGGNNTEGWNPDAGTEPPTGGSDGEGTHGRPSEPEIDVFTKDQFDALVDGMTQNPDMHNYANRPGSDFSEPDDKYEWGEALYIVVWNLLDPNYSRQDGNTPAFDPTTGSKTRTDSTVQITLKSRAPGEQADTAEMLTVPDSGKGYFMDQNEPTKPVFYAKYVYRFNGSAGGKTQTPGSTITLSVRERPANSGPAVSKDTVGESVVPVKPALIADRDKYVPEVYTINNPLAIVAGGIPVGCSSVTYVTDKNNAQAQVNGNGGLLPLVQLGAAPHGTTSARESVMVGDRSLLGRAGLTLNRVRVERGDVLWSGGPGAIVGQLPWEIPPPQVPGQPNISPDYPDIPHRNVNCITAGSNVNMAVESIGLPGTPSSSGSPWEIGRAPVNTSVSVPRFQPANLAGGYIGKVYVYVDSNNNGRFEKPGELGAGRIIRARRAGTGAEAYREFNIQVGVHVDRTIEVEEDIFDIGQVPHGFGWTPAADLTPAPFFPDWAPTVAASPAGFGNWFKTFTANHLGNTNLFNVKLARNANNEEIYLLSDTVQGPQILGPSNGAWFGIPAGYVTSTLDAQFTDDVPTTMEIGRRTFTKPRVGGSPTTLTVPDNPPGVVIGGPIYKPQLSVAAPLGLPAGTYQGVLTLFDDVNGDGIYDMATESLGNPPMKVVVSVTEARLTDGYTAGSVPHLDDRAPGGVTAADMSPAAFISPETRDLYLAFVSNRYGSNPGVATDPWYLYMPSLTHDGVRWKFNSNSGWFNPTDPTDTAKAFRFPPSDKIDAGAAGTFFPGPPNGAPGDVLESSVKFSSPSLVLDKASRRAWLMVVGSAIKDPGAAGVRGSQGRATETRAYYLELTDPGNPANIVLAGKQAYATTQDWSMPKFGLRGAVSYLSKDISPTLRNGDMWLWSFWYGGNNDKWRMFYTINPHPDGYNAIDGQDWWSNSTQLPVPNGLTSVAEPAPVSRQVLGWDSAAGAPRSDVMELVYTGFSAFHKNSDIYLSRFTPGAERTVSRGSYIPLSLQNLPRVRDEVLTRSARSTVWWSKHVDWASGFRVWVAPDRNNMAVRYEITAASSQVDPVSGAYAYTEHTYADGRRLEELVRGAVIDPTSGTVKLLKSPGPNSVIVVEYTPRAYRLTTDDASDVSPCAVLDDYANPRYNSADPANPFVGPAGGPVRTDRLWVFWRRPGLDKPGTGIHYKTFRHMVKPDRQLTKPAGQPAVTINGVSTPVEVDWVKNRLYFMSQEDGREVQITYTYVNPDGSHGEATETHAVMLDEESPVGGVFGNLTRVMVNEGQVSAFKDPFSNKMWVFWSSTRSGNTDIYYEAISPNFYGAEFR